MPSLKLHWTLNPIFAFGLTYDELGKPTSPWYENEKRRSTSLQEIAAELDIDYDASNSGKVFPDFDMEVNVVENLKYNPALPLYVSWDFGLDATCCKAVVAIFIWSSDVFCWYRNRIVFYSTLTVTVWNCAVSSVRCDFTCYWRSFTLHLEQSVHQQRLLVLELVLLVFATSTDSD